MTTARNGRPSVSVVMPFAGTREEALAAVEALGRLHVLDGDQLLLADNAGVLAGTGAGAVERPTSGGGGGIELRTSGGTVAVAAAPGERSPAHARNAGAAAARPDAEWILFLDADTIAPDDLIDRYFAETIDDDVGALAGGVRAAPPEGGGRGGLAARYGAHKNFLDAGSHLAHPFMPRAAAANLLVRRTAFEAVGGFFEGLRAAEDTDFSWRLQLAGWRLIGAPGAVVEHRYRDSVVALRRQWRSYAAGRAWLGRRYEGFAPRPAVLRAASRAVVAVSGPRATAVRAPAPVRAPRATAARTVAPVRAPRATAARAPAPARAPSARSPATRAAFAALDVLLGLEELVGFGQANRPTGAASKPAPGDTHCVLVADRFPTPGVAAAPGARVEAAARPDRAAPPPPGVTVTYREDDGLAERAAALLRLGLAAPAPTLAALAHDPRATVALAPAADRLRAEPSSTLAATAPEAAQDERRLARLAGREPRP